MALYLIDTDARIGHVVQVHPRGPRPDFEGQVIAAVRRSRHAVKQLVVMPLNNPGDPDYFALEDEIDGPPARS